MESGLFESAASLGVGAFLAVVIAVLFLWYIKLTLRKMSEDRDSSEERISSVHQAHCAKLEQIVEGDQKSREKNTAALTELTTQLRLMNGGRKR